MKFRQQSKAIANLNYKQYKNNPFNEHELSNKKNLKKKKKKKKKIFHTSQAKKDFYYLSKVRVGNRGGG